MIETEHRQALLDGLLSEREDSSTFREDTLRLAFILPSDRSLNLLDKMEAEFAGVVPNKQ